MGGEKGDDIELEGVGDGPCCERFGDQLGGWRKWAGVRRGGDNFWASANAWAGGIFPADDGAYGLTNDETNGCADTSIYVCTDV